MNQQSALKGCITSTNVSFLPAPYRGKVRDVYTLPNNHLAIISSDRISAFDHILRQPIPFKGQILNTLAAFFFEKVSDIVETHIIDVPHPNITIAKACKALPIEVVVRGYLTGHAWRTYKSGKRTLCGVTLPEEMIENQIFAKPILTPATKAVEGHDEDISEQEILDRKIIAPELWEEVRNAAFALFERGTQITAEKGLILVDTKYEFGIFENRLVLIDEVHTPDSSRYFYADGYHENLHQNKPQRQLSKEFIREWLMSKGFQGLDGQTLPDLSDDFRMQVTDRYSELFRQLTGKEFQPVDTSGFSHDLERILREFS